MPKRGPPPASRKPPPAVAEDAQTRTGALSRSRRRAMRNAAIALVVTLSVFLLGYLLLPALFDFPTAPLDRLIFVLRAEIFVFLWVVVAFRVASGNRFFGPATGDSPRSPANEQQGLFALFASNTLQQAAMALVAHLALATLLEGPGIALIVGAVLLFSLGRAVFIAGLRPGSGLSSLGMMITALPTTLCYCAAIILLIVRLPIS